MIFFNPMYSMLSELFDSKIQIVVQLSKRAIRKQLINHVFPEAHYTTTAIVELLIIVNHVV